MSRLREVRMAAKPARVAVGTALLIAGFGAAAMAGSSSVVWTSKGAPTEATITNGPWTLEQSGAANGLKSSAYCDSLGNQIGNSGTERMSPYYFPGLYSNGASLQGLFDYRPKDIDEAIAAAQSTDNGQTWTFQSKALELRTLCPANLNAEPDGDPETTPNPNNSDNIDDDGQGHGHIVNVAGKEILYTLNRSVNHIDVDGLVYHVLTPTTTNPLGGAPILDDGPTDGNNPGDLSNSAPEPSGTVGLLNPDGILAAVPSKRDSATVTIIYEQKILNGDDTGSTALPPSEQCGVKPGSVTTGPWAAFYGANGLSPNNDITYLRLASTIDGVNFTDLGSLKGLNDITTVSANGTRWLATAGVLIELPGNRWGLFFSGGNCADADSDSFHYIGYAESSDLLNWTVINGLNNPILSISPYTIYVNSNGVPVGDGSGSTGGTATTIPANPAVAGNTLGFFAGRVYGPTAVKLDNKDITMLFAGYHTHKPKNGLGDYRNIGHLTLHSSSPLLTVGESLSGGQ